MKKSVLLFGLLSTAVCLAACGPKNFDMSFEEALEIANHSALQDVLAQNDNYEQSFDISGNFEAEWNKVDAHLSSDSKQSSDSKFSESSLKLTAGLTSSWKTVKLDWALDIRLVNDTIYLYLSSLDLTWDDSLTMVGMLAEWFTNKWFSVPMSGLSDVSNSFFVLKDSNKLNNRVKEIVKNEWHTTYSWKFEQFNGYNAWKFSLDNEKLNALIKEYYNSVNSSIEGEEPEEIPELNIQNFEWYLVINWKDKVTTVIESMNILDDDAVMNADWFAGEDYEINLSEGWEALVNILAKKDGSKYNISLGIADSISLKWTISPKISKSSIDLKFDATLMTKAEEEWKADNVIPFKGSWKYSPISEFTVDIPEGAQDLNDLLASYLWWMMWWDDYDENEEYDNLLEDMEGVEESMEEYEDTEAIENTEEVVAE